MPKDQNQHCSVFGTTYFKSDFHGHRNLQSSYFVYMMFIFEQTRAAANTK